MVHCNLRRNDKLSCAFRQGWWYTTCQVWPYYYYWETHKTKLQSNNNLGLKTCYNYKEDHEIYCKSKPTSTQNLKPSEDFCFNCAEPNYFYYMGLQFTLPNTNMVQRFFPLKILSLRVFSTWCVFNLLLFNNRHLFEWVWSLDYILSEHQLELSTMT